MRLDHLLSKDHPEPTTDVRLVAGQDMPKLTHADVLNRLRSEMHLLSSALKKLHPSRITGPGGHWALRELFLENCIASTSIFFMQSNLRGDSKM